MIVVTGDSVNQLFARACSAVLEQGEQVAPRGLETLEVLGAHLRLTDPRRRLLDIPPTRVLNPAFAMAETIWILSGSGDPWIYDFNDALRQFTDDGILQGAYGPRMRHWRRRDSGIVDQLDAVRRLLTVDPDSRRAVIQLFDPACDFLGHRDVPCTLGYRFYLRGGHLHMHTTMRSQDLWLGFGYDVFASTVIQELLAGWLNVNVGEYHHHVDSLHLYAPVLDQAAALPEEGPPGERVDVPAIPWPHFEHALNRVLGLPGVTRGGSGDTDCSEGDWAEAALVLSSYRSWKRGDRLAARRRAEGAPGTMARALHRWYQHLDAKSGPAGSDRRPVPAGEQS